MRSSQAEETEAEKAIARVLQAERDAQETIARCRAECAQLVADARGRAEAVRARSEARIATLRERMSAALEKRIHALDSAVEPEASGNTKDPALRERLQRAAAALVEELTGSAQEFVGRSSDKLLRQDPPHE